MGSPCNRRDNDPTRYNIVPIEIPSSGNRLHLSKFLCPKMYYRSTPSPKKYYKQLSMLLVTPHNLTVRLQMILAWKLQPFWFVSIVIESVVPLPQEKSNHQSHTAVNPEHCYQDCLTMCPQLQQQYEYSGITN